MKVVIRTDASIEIGTGHLMRCLTLAGALRGQGAEAAFICREIHGDCGDLIKVRGFPLYRLPDIGGFEETLDAKQTAVAPFFNNSPDWLVVDHYGIGEEWERCLRPQVGRLMVIDDLANRTHDCDILLDQNLFEDMLRRYDGLTPSGCRMFLGPRFALLRDEFIEARRTLRERDGIVRRILMFFGGSDLTNETEKALLAIQELNCPDVNVDVVVGSANPKGDKIESICAAMPNVTFHRQVANMAALMAHADLAIGAGGTTTWERCFMGVPALVVVVADNQAKPAQAADNAGLARLVGRSADVTVSALATAIRQALQQPEALVAIANRCLSLMGQRYSPINEEILTCLHGVTDVP